MRTGQSTGLRAVGAVALAAALALTGCGRDEGSGTESAKAEKVESGKATGAVTVWAMGAEGEKLGEIAADFEAENPDAKVKVTRDPVRRRARQDRHRDRRRRDPGRQPGRHAPGWRSSRPAARWTRRRPT